MADATNVQMLLLWLKLVQMLLPDSSLAFPEFDGKAIGHLERKIETATRPLGHSLPTATTFRKELEIRNKRQEGPVREAVSRALSHSLSTAQQYYQAPTLSDTYSAYDAIGCIIGGDTATSLSLPAASNPKEKGKVKGKEKARVEELEESDVPTETDVEEEERDGSKGKKRRMSQWESERENSKGQKSRKPRGEEKEERGGKKRSKPQEEEEKEERGGKKRSKPQEEEEEEEEIGSSKRKKRREEEEKEERGGNERKRREEVEKGLSSSACKGKRKGFSKQEEKLVVEFFKTHISTRQLPTSKECREFLDLFPMDRSPKDIYDKCRNIAGRYY